MSEPTMNVATPASGQVSDTGGVRYRAAAVAVGAAEIRRAENGTWYLRSREPLGDYPTRLTDCLVRGAQAHPDRVLAARRGADGRWIEITYAQMLERARALGQ
ncbi:feruloyl-CoA synthase, partial [Paraburkholderia sp. SIMBA_049]